MGNLCDDAKCRILDTKLTVTNDPLPRTCTEQHAKAFACKKEIKQQLLVGSYLTRLLIEFTKQRLKVVLQNSLASNCNTLCLFIG
jgi:hypothetical protein